MLRPPKNLRNLPAFLLLVGMMLGAGAAEAQDVRVQALVSETTVGTEETVSFSLEISGVSFAEVETPAAPPTEGLVLLQSFPSTQSNFSIINGQVSQSIVYQWRFRPVREGIARVKPMTVRVQGRDHTTEEIRVTVVPQSQRPSRPNRARPTPFAQRSAPADDPPARSNIADGDLFIRAIPSARRAYQNEQVTVEYQLFFRSHIQPRHSRLADSWDAEGFWREDLAVESRPMPRATVENGLRYNTITLKRVAVFPTRNGTLTIDPLKIETEVFAPQRINDPFSRFFSSANPYETIDLASPPIRIEARPLPEGAPPGFQGAVGQFTFEAQLDRTAVEVGEPLQLTLRIAGSGNLAMLEAPPLDVPGLFETYDPQVDLSINNSGRRVQGHKTFTYLLVPRSNGRIELPALAFSYFDPQAAAYRTLRADPLTVTVTGSADTPASSATAAGLPVDDIAPLLLVADWHRLDRAPLYRRPATYLALLLPLLLLGLLLGYRKYTHRLATDVAYARNRRAHPLARKHLKRAEALRQQDEPRAFFEEVERAVRGFVGNRLNVAELGLTRPELDARLAEAGLEAALRADLQRLLETCDRARFAPHRPTAGEMEATLDDARRLLPALDEALSRALSVPA